MISSHTLQLEQLEDRSILAADLVTPTFREPLPSAIQDQGSSAETATDPTIADSSSSPNPDSSANNSELPLSNPDDSNLPPADNNDDGMMESPTSNTPFDTDPPLPGDDGLPATPVPFDPSNLFGVNAPLAVDNALTNPSNGQADPGLPLTVTDDIGSRILRFDMPSTTMLSLNNPGLNQATPGTVRPGFTIFGSADFGDTGSAAEVDVDEEDEQLDNASVIDPSTVAAVTLAVDAELLDVPFTDAFIDQVISEEAHQSPTTVARNTEEQLEPLSIENQGSFKDIERVPAPAVAAADMVFSAMGIPVLINAGQAADIKEDLTGQL